MPTIDLKKIGVEKGHNPREHIDDIELKELAESIKARGLLQPIVVREAQAKGDGNNEFIVVAGHRRYYAAQLAKEATIEAIVKDDGKPDENVIDALTENLQRSDLTKLEEAKAYQRMKDVHRWNAKRIAHELGLPQARITKRLQLLSLPVAAVPFVDQLNNEAVKFLALVQQHSTKAADMIASILGETHEDGESVIDVINDSDGRGWLLRSAFTPSDEFPVVDTEDQLLVNAWGPIPKDVAERYTAMLEIGRGHYLPLGKQEIDQAKSLGAFFEYDGHGFVAGRDVIAELRNEALKRALSEFEQYLKESEAASDEAGEAPGEDEQERQQARQVEADHYGGVERADTGKSSSKVVYDPDTKGLASEEKAKEIRKQRRDAEHEARQNAIGYNDELGKRLLDKADYEPDSASMRLIVNELFSRCGTDMVKRGLRFMHPNGRTTERLKNGHDKTKYVEDEAGLEQLLDDFMAPAKTASQVAGRAMVILVSAYIADEQAVAESNRGGAYPGLSAKPASQSLIADDVWRVAKKMLTPGLYDRATNSVKERARPVNSYTPNDPQPPSSGDRG